VCSRLKYRCVLGGDCLRYRAGCGRVVFLCAAALSTDVSLGAMALSIGLVVGVWCLCVQPP
jgi:hypothetical protein